MKRHTRKRWVGVCLLGAALGGAGCTYSVQRPLPDCCTAATAHAAGGPVVLPGARPWPPTQPGTADRPAQLPPVTRGDASGGPMIAPVPAAAVTAVVGSRFQDTTPPAARPGTTPQPLLVADARQLAPRKKRPRSRPVLGFDASGAEVRQVAASPQVIEQVSHQSAPAEAAPHAHEPAVRRGFIDLTAQPWFGCAEDHSWLNGQARYSKTTNAWRLHYASVDDNDPYGGTVTLVTGEALKGLKDGQYVRVFGCPVDADRREAGAPYRVTSFEVVAHPQ